LGPSRTLGRLLFGLYAAAGLSWLWVPLTWPLRCGLYGLLVGHAWYLYRLHVVASLPSAIRALAWHPRQGWRLCGNDGVWHRAQPCWPAFVSAHLVAVRFRTGRLAGRRVIVVADRVDGQAFRRLRVRLLQCVHADRD
jgi:hypothetical protein